MAWALAEARSKGVRLYVEGLAEPVLIDGDPVRIEQIVWNLLSNAVKFTRSGGSVAVRLSHDDEEALLDVTDTGRGIAPEFLPQVFEMFSQADAATTRDEGGLGIGLALVQSLVELHGGRVAAESAGRGAGTTLRVWLPLHQPTGFGELDAAEEAERDEPSPAPGCCSSTTRPTCSRPSASCSSTTARGSRRRAAARRRCALAETEDFDLLISDVGMPGMDGYQLIAEMRRRPRTAGLPAIALTGHGRHAGRRARPAVGIRCACRQAGRLRAACGRRWPRCSLARRLPERLRIHPRSRSR